MSRILRALFSRRRWLMWLGVPGAAVLDHGSLSGYFTMLEGCSPLRLPYWLACRLSDGFDNVTVGGGSLEHRPGVNPATGQACVVLTSRETGAPMAWLGGNDRTFESR